MQSSITTVAECHGHKLALHLVTDIVVKPHLRDIVRRLCNDDSKTGRFPGPNPVSLDTSHFGQLRKEPYYACEKTDGVRFLMVVCELDDLNIVAIMDRTWNFYIVPLKHVPKAMFQGTVLDGEIAWNKDSQQWEYLVFDATCVSGVPVLDSPLDGRLAAARKALSLHRPAPEDPVAVRLKTFVACTSFGDVDSLLESCRVKYDIDGIVLTPAHAPVVYGRHTTMFKLKFDNRHTVDFMVGDGGSLCVWDSGRHVSVGELRNQGDARRGTIVECSFGQDGVWDLVMIRTDKKTANDMFTYRKTLLNMRENLTLDHVRRVWT